MRPMLVTGTAGFIGSHVALKLLADGHRVIGFDNLSDYYDVNLKKARLPRFENNPGYTHIIADLADREAVEDCFANHRPDRVIHLAAQAGVRYAAENPNVYSSNVTGTLHVLEGCRHYPVKHLVFASTSSVYGANTKMPFKEGDGTEQPLTLYAATKKANEMMAHSYAYLYQIPSTGLRFFTVYGPWGRPDMALFLFTKAILSGESIQVFNHGKYRCSFTCIDDIVESILRILQQPPEADPGWNSDAPNTAASGVAPYRIFNIGNESSIELLRYIEVLEECLGKKALMKMLPLQPGDVPDTESDVTSLAEAIDYTPKVDVERVWPTSSTGARGIIDPTLATRATAPQCWRCRGPIMQQFSSLLTGRRMPDRKTSVRRLRLLPSGRVQPW